MTSGIQDLSLKTINMAIDRVGLLRIRGLVDAMPELNEKSLRLKSKFLLAFLGSGSLSLRHSSNTRRPSARN